MNKEKKNTFTYAFKQQILRAWQPVPTLKSTVVIFIVLGLIFLAFGIALLILSNQIIDYRVQYDEVCEGDTTCTVQIEVTEKMESPVFFYYELDNFYQNHRRYLKSRNSDQLSGSVLGAGDLDDCDPIVYNKDIKTPLYSLDGTLLDPEGVANPCGLVAKSFFNDSFVLNSGAIDIEDTGIAWASDVKNKFKAPENAAKIQWTDVTNERFIVWMRTAATPNFRKLWGRIEQDLNPGTYTVDITNNYDVSGFDGKKYIVISTANTFGGKNYFLAISYLVVGGLAIGVAILFFIKNLVSPPKNLPKFE